MTYNKTLEGEMQEVKAILLRNFDNDKYLWSKAHLELESFLTTFAEKIREGVVEEVEKLRLDTSPAEGYNSPKADDYNQALDEVISFITPPQQ